MSTSNKWDIVFQIFVAFLENLDFMKPECNNFDKKVPFVAFCHPAQGQVSLSRFIESPLFQSCGENFSIPLRLGRRHYRSRIDGRTKTMFCFPAGT
jgi:hypothetical protein